MKLKFCEVKRMFTFLLVALSVVGCQKLELSSDDVEYRQSEEGELLLYEIGEEEPFEGIIVDEYDNGHTNCKIEFKDGLRDGNFTFWRENETPLSKGKYRKGLRHGKFTAYGGAGELISEKTYANGKLNGPCNFYYRYSNDEVERFFLRLDEEGLEIKEKNSDGIFDDILAWFYGTNNVLKPKSVLRYTCNFVDDAPSGVYEAYFFEGEEANSTTPLLRERGFFDANGSLHADQVRYFPKVKTLAIKLPHGRLMSEGFEADLKGLSIAMESAYKAIEELPAYRNRKDQPAKIFALDERGNEIVPIWSTDIFEIVIRDLNGSFLETRYGHTFEQYEKAKQIAEAEFLRYEHGISVVERSEESLDPDEVRSIDRRKTTLAIEVLGIDKNGKVIEVLWTSDPDSHVIALHERITKERELVQRAWLDGKSWGVRWYLPDGSKLSILDERIRKKIRADDETTTSSEKKVDDHGLLP
jgi:antitoxin component YwqK of YwqJK toxin-antitoxin module